MVILIWTLILANVVLAYIIWLQDRQITAIIKGLNKLTLSVQMQEEFRSLEDLLKGLTNGER